MPDLGRITQSFVLDFKKPVVNRLKVVNGDTANTFVITLKNGGQAVQLSADLHKVIAVFKRADGQVYTQDASTGLTFTTTGVVTIDVRPASFRSGTNTVELQVYKRESVSATEYPLLATTYPQVFIARNETLTGESEHAPSQLPMLERYVLAAKSYANGHTGTREGENIDNAMYYKDLAEQAVQGGIVDPTVADWLESKTDHIDGVIEDEVDDWLDDHPEATTTVQDGAVTHQKLGADVNSHFALLDTDVSELKSTVSELESAGSDTFNDLFVSTSGNITFTSQGYMNPSTGSSSSSDKYCRTDAVEMPESGVYRVTPKAGYKVCLRNYTDGIEVSDFTSSPFAFVAESGKSYRWCIGKTDGADLLLSNVPGDAVAWERLKTDVSLTQTNKAADAKATGEKIAENSKTIENVIDSLDEESLCIGIIDGISAFEAGAINGSGEDANTSSYQKNSFRMGWYQGVRFALKIASAVTQENATNYYHYINFYDISGAFLSRAGGSKVATVEADVPSNAATFRVTLTAITNETYGSANVTSYTCRLLVDNGAYHASPKNVWYVLGDSISAGYYSMTASMAAAAGLTLDYTSQVTTDQGETTGSVYDQTLEHNYWGYANKWKLHRRIIRLARPGQGYFKKTSANKNGIDVVSDNGFSDAGLITVAWGFNDWHYDMPRGNHDLIDPSVPYPSENFDVTQITTINQAIWFCLGTLIRKAPNAKIVVQTPMNGWAYGGDFASNWGIGTAKTNSGTLANIHDDIKFWADYYGLQILEMTYNNSMINRLNIKTALIDGSHPSDAAHQQLGRHVAEMLGYC